MANPAYYYGSFNLNDNISYFVMEKPYDLVAYQQTLFKIARLEGMKKTGEVVNERTFAVKVKIIATTRVGLEQAIENLYQALALRQQHLILYATDQRYFVADCASVQCSLVGGLPISAVATVTFTCQQPWAFASSASSYTSGVLGCTGGPSVWNAATQTFAGGGSVYSRPLLTLANSNPNNNTTLTTALTSGNTYTSIAVAALPAAVNNGDDFVLTSSTHTQTVMASAGVAAGATTIPVTSFVANFAYPTTTTVQRNNSWTSVTVTQQTDNQVFTMATGLPVVYGDTLYIYCDPTVTHGWTVLLNNTGNPLAFTGIFPVLEPQNTAWAISITAVSQPFVTASWTWTARYLT